MLCIYRSTGAKLQSFSENRVLCAHFIILLQKIGSDLQIIVKSVLGIHKLHDAVYARRLARQLVDENIGWVHILQSQTVGNVVHSLPLPVVTEAFFGNHRVYLVLGGQS